MTRRDIEARIRFHLHGLDDECFEIAEERLIPAPAPGWERMLIGLFKLTVIFSAIYALLFSRSNWLVAIPSGYVTAYIGVMLRPVVERAFNWMTMA